MAHMVQCVKLGRWLPGLQQPPFPDKLGQRIYENVSAQGYALWPPHATMIINHNELSLGNANHRDFLYKQMEDFFFGQDAKMPEGWIPQGQRPAKGGGGFPPRRK
ncbi:MAG: oxidative damage protection protein [Ardenticatenaceae bacterium]